jgi:hypothetical protein
LQNPTHFPRGVDVVGIACVLLRAAASCGSGYLILD